jgi:PAS domain-containing protein
MVDTADMTTGRNPIGALRRDRDRFVALAFSAADILLELDADHTVVFAAGATGALLGREPSQLQGRAFAEIVADPDCAMVAEAMSLAKQGSRIKGLVTGSARTWSKPARPACPDLRISRKPRAPGWPGLPLTMMTIP